MKLLSTCMRANGTPPAAAGFTLVEMLIVIALIGAVASMGLFVSFSLHGRSSAESERDAVVMLLDRARSHSMNNLYGVAHGLCLDSEAGEYRAFRTPYSANDTEESMPHTDAVSVTGIPECGAGGEIVFKQLSGDTAPVSISVSEGHAAYSIELNRVGTILW